MDFGMDSSFGYLVGILMSANAIFNLLILFCHPEFRNGHLSSTMDPTANYTEGSEVSTSMDYYAHARVTDVSCDDANRRLLSCCRRTRTS